MPDPDVFPKWVKSKLDSQITNGKSIIQLCEMEVSFQLVKVSLHVFTLLVYTFIVKRP